MPKDDLEEKIRKEVSQYTKVGRSDASKEYKEFKQELKEASISKTIFEKACNFSEKVFPLKPSQKTEEKLQDAIDFLDYNIKPRGVMAFAILSSVLLAVISILTLILDPGIIPYFIKLSFFVSVPLSFILIIYYPITASTSQRIKTSGELVLGVLYMCVYMKNNLNLEGAVRFTAENVSGKLSRDLKLLLWKLETRSINSIDEGLSEYIKKWRTDNREFVDSIELIKASTFETNAERRQNLLDRAITVILEGTDEKMKKYSRNLEMRITLIHALGILLPVLGMIVFPMISIFLTDTSKHIAAYLFFGYNIILPLFVLYFINDTLSKRPTTRPRVNLSSRYKLNPKSIRIANTFIPMWSIAVVVTAILLGTDLFLYLNVTDGFFSNGLFQSLLFVWSIALGIIVYSFGLSYGKLKQLQKIRLIESQLENALFAWGNRLYGGMPLEQSLMRATKDIEDLEISEFLQIASDNMVQKNMTFKQSFFNAENGALRYYPSKLLETVTKALSETLVKGSTAVATTMLVISQYMRNIRMIQEKIEDLLSSIVSSMKLQAYLLAPLISGVVVAASEIMIKMLITISRKVDVFKGSEFLEANPLEILIDIKSVIPAEVLQIVVGLYLIELLFLFARFINRIEVGDDDIREHDITWKTILIGLSIYTLITVSIITVFSGFIQMAVANI